MTVLCICAISLLEANMQVKNHAPQDLCHGFTVWPYKDFQADAMSKQVS